MRNNRLEIRLDNWKNMEVPAIMCETRSNWYGTSCKRRTHYKGLRSNMDARYVNCQLQHIDWFLSVSKLASYRFERGRKRTFQSMVYRNLSSIVWYIFFCYLLNECNRSVDSQLKSPRYMRLEPHVVIIVCFFFFFLCSSSSMWIARTHNRRSR